MSDTPKLTLVDDEAPQATDYSVYTDRELAVRFFNRSELLIRGIDQGRMPTPWFDTQHRLISAVAAEWLRRHPLPEGQMTDDPLGPNGPALREVARKLRRAIPTSTPDAVPDVAEGVVCPEHGKQGLTLAQYNRQMNRPNSLWTCPICGEAAMWDDDRYGEMSP